MTQKFKVGDCVQFVAGNKHRLGAIVSEKNNHSYIVEDDYDTYIIHKSRVAPAPALVKIPAVVDKFLKTDADGYTIYDRMAQLIVVNDGDHYHLEEAAVENEVLTREEALEVINYAHEAKCEDLLQLVNGYEVEKEQLYEIVIVKSCVDRQLLFEIGDTIEVRYESENEGHWKQRYTEAEILKIDKYDDTNYWQFAVSVEEGEG
ncbi:DUF1642 domain-containing protein [Listeria booriae]|uniref:DUF1642 domain-containing protein n=1 Tax=Listeria booriae TaxID=1552123 RepID=UPI00162AB273|nr:DUF1642 domain-containing protein [Listeria booriae]MBC2163445.1 DUF1642 domain-containing protein [Listeria booriae]